jgi:hypothetical protein
MNAPLAFKLISRCKLSCTYARVTTEDLRSEEPGTPTEGSYAQRAAIKDAHNVSIADDMQPMEDDERECICLEREYAGDEPPRDQQG